MVQLREAFPEVFFQHCFAIKANPIRGVLKAVLDTGFMGVECGSMGEVMLAHQCGFPPEKVVFDCPVKSKVSQKCQSLHYFMRNLQPNLTIME